MSEAGVYDVAVLGLGAVGSMAAWHAAERGASVIGFEQFGEVHPRGSYHGTTRIFRRTQFDGVEYVPLVERAKVLWDELERRTGRPLFQRCGGLCIGPPDSSLVKVALDSARTAGFDHELIDEDALAERFAQHQPIPGDVAVYEPDAGVLNPEECIRAGVAMAKQHGAVLAYHTKVRSLTHDDSGVDIVTDTGRVRARRAILATGAWFTELIPELRLPLDIVRSPLVWFTGADRAAYRPDRFPAFIRKGHGLDGWGIPDVDGRGVKIGAGPSAPKTSLESADDNDYPIDERDTAPAEEFCARAFPGLNPVHVSAEPCMNSRTDDRTFVIGISDTAPSLVLAGGFSGHGFKHAPATGEISVDLALDGATEVPIEKFSPRRFDRVANAPGA